MTLLELIKDGLKEEDKKIVPQLDFQKSNDEIIADMIKSGFLNFEYAEKNDKKLTKLNNVFSYSFFDWDKINFVTFVDNDGNQKTRDGHFVKNNVIFAENANGKSKLVDIFKSLDGQDKTLEKHRDHKSEEQEAKIILDDDSEIDFSGTAWSNEKLKSKFVIFDKPFVQNFVHSVGTDDDDTAQRRQKRGRNIVYLGNFEKYSEEIEGVNSLKVAISEKNRLFLQTEQSKIAGLLTGHGISTEELLGKKIEIKKLNKDNLQKESGATHKNNKPTLIKSKRI